MAVLDDATASGRELTIAPAVEHWAAQLIDLTRRNNLLFFKDLRTGTLDLGNADPEHVHRLLRSEPVRMSRLYPDEADRQQTRRRLTELRRKIRALAEERGIDAGYVALGMLSWPAPVGASTASTRSPVLLRPLSITAKGVNAADFELVLAESAELNPVLAYALHKHTSIETADVAKRLEPIPLGHQLDTAVELLRERASAAEVHLEVEEKLVAGAFAYEKLPMVRDLEESIPLLAGHRLVAALAGDPAAQQALDAQPEPHDTNPDEISPGNEHIVLDADPSQQSAITAALAGSDLIVQGPPGTGKSQTIANLITSAAAEGKKVLFVAQKRAAIDAVVNNLRERDLADLVLDLHDPKTSRREVVEQLKLSMDRARQTPPADLGSLHRTLVERRDRLSNFSKVLTAPREPSRLSILDLQQRLLTLHPSRDPGVRLSPSTLDRLPAEALERLEDELRLFVEDDGLRLLRAESPWASARGVVDNDTLRTVRAQLDHLTGSELRTARGQLERIITGTGLPWPESLADWSSALSLLGGVAQCVATHGTHVFDEELDHYRAAFATRAWRKEARIRIGVWRRRALRQAADERRRQAAAERRQGDATRATMFEELSEAAALRDQWATLTDGRRPLAVAGLDELAERYQQLHGDLAAIGAATLMDGLAQRPQSELDHALRELKDDEDMLFKLPVLNGHRARYEELGLSELLDRIAAHDLAPNEAAEALRFAWLSSHLHELRATVPEYAHFSAEKLGRAIKEFEAADLQHLDTAASRVRRRVAEQQVRARDRWPEQRRLINDQVARKRGHKTIRALVDEAGDLMLATRPCWAMSPLVVSQVLPGRTLFDLVVFDEASQIEPADAIPAIVRGEHVVVAGDNNQLPPTPFFATAAGEDDELDDDMSLGAYESILDVLSRQLPTKTLTWHYRSEDDRLIAHSNRDIYNHQLRTFPSTSRRPALTHVLVTPPASSNSADYRQAEVERVAQLVVGHAEQRPNDSLGVIALGLTNAMPIAKEIQRLQAERPDLASFFDEDAAVRRRFFVKSIENVQGDERDAIILSLGGSRRPNGEISMSFGPVNQRGGERRLNVAVTRARRSMTVVSTFGPHELPEEKLTSRGLTFLRDYLSFVIKQATDGTAEAGRREPPEQPLSSIEERLIERLRTEGINAVPRYGTSISRIDIAIEHPEQRGEFVLAVDTDRHEHHRPEVSVRERDRLRPQQLRRKGWRHHRVWTSDWLRDPDRQVEQVKAALVRASTTMADHDVHGRLPQRSWRPPPAAAEPAPPQRKRKRPIGIVPGTPIDQYPRWLLVDVVEWIDSDGLLRDEEEMINTMKAELGYQRRGKNIVAALQQAIRDARGPARP